MKKPSIFLCMPKHYGFSQVIAEHLRLHGFHVDDLSIHTNDEFRRPNFAERLEITFRKKVLHQAQAKDAVVSRNNLQKIQQNRQHILKIIKESQGVDYALFIRGDLYDDELIHAISEKTRKRMVNYQWDGLSRYPEIYKKLALFETNFVFDPNDVGSYHQINLLPATNFWFDRIKLPNKLQNDCYFLGVHNDGLQRDKAIVHFAQYAQNKGMVSDISMFHFHSGSMEQHSAIYPVSNIQATRHARTYQENLNHMLRSKLLIDFKNPVHQGLSFRPFEALGYAKKLVTTHDKIAQYDFYHPDNIFIWDGENTAGLDEFIAKPYRPVDEQIRQKYSFGNWIRYILDIPPYQAITLPKINQKP